MSTELPEGVNPSRPPTGVELEAMTEDDISRIITWWANNNQVSMGVGFWLDELGRRRSERQLGRVIGASETNVELVARMVELTEAGERQNKEMHGMTHELRRLTRIIAGLTLINAAAAIVAAVTVF